MGKHVVRSLIAVVVSFAAQSAFAAPAYRYIIGSSMVLNSSCKSENETKKTYLKLYIPDGAGQSATDTVAVKIHACIMGKFMASNFVLRLPLKAWSESANGTGSFKISSSLMASEFGAKGSGSLTAKVVDQDALSGVPGFKVGTHYPLKSLRIQIPGYGVTLNATLQRIQKD